MPKKQQNITKKAKKGQKKQKSVDIKGVICYISNASEEEGNKIKGKKKKMFFEN